MMVRDGAKTTLATQIRVRPGYLRATNLEHHTGHAEYYILTGRALDILGRLSKALRGNAPGHAWSLTGPYGAGKSSFGVFLRTLLGPAGSARDACDDRLRVTSREAWEALTAGRDDAGASTRGFVLATTTCQPESVTESILRGLERGVHEFWPTQRPRAVSEALTQARTARTARAVAAATAAVAEHAPVLLILDEFGKTLEHFAAHAAHSSDTDLFVLQELAEQAAGRHPVLLLTLQHLAFDDYVRSAALSQRREWGKIAGRFEDVPFLETAEQSLRLVAGALDDAALGEATADRRRAWSCDALSQLARLGMETRLPGGPETLEHCFPLHPVALLALPELCSRLGQHGRTLFTFLASSERHTLGGFLERTELPPAGDTLPVLRLPDVFDFFAGPGRSLSAAAGPRWTEIDTRIREATGLPDEDLACLKVVGLLNLLADATGLRASADIVSYALGPADQQPDLSWYQRLEDLEGRGWLTYRGFADEYRLWQGSDVDLRTRVADAREQLRSVSPAGLLSTLHTNGPLIAGKHTQRVGMLRYFAPSYADVSSRRLTPLVAEDPADGALVYYLGDPNSLTSLDVSTDRRPVLLATSSATNLVQDAAVEAAAALAVLDQRDVAADRVARRELQDRAADARRRLATALEEAFRPGSRNVTYRLHTADGWGTPLTADAGLSRLLSDVCDQAYSASPEIRNEMLGRRELTSQGAKARRQLLEAMVMHPHEEQLTLTGYGPERSMYEALLRHTELHAKGPWGSWGFHKPMAGSSLNHAWGLLTMLVNGATEMPVGADTLYARLKAPPIGLKEGPIPVLLTAFLLHRADDVAVYQDGTYQPDLTVELLERLVKAPERFAVKAFNLAGPRGRVLDPLLTAAGLQPSSLSRGRNATVLRAAAPLLTAVRGLPAFTLKTKTALSSDAEHVRDALLNAREPDVLLFADLPAACGLPPIPTRTTPGTAEVIETYAQRLSAALQELTGALPATLGDCSTALADELALSDVLPELRAELRVRARTLDGRVLEPRLRAFLFAAASSELDDDAWIESLALTISGRPPAAWTDDDLAHYHVNLHEIAGAFQRVEALHFDAAARRNDGFTAHRVTITAPDGQEASSVVWVDHSSAPLLEELATTVLDTARDRLGAIGPRALLAVIAGKTLGLGVGATDTGPASISHADLNEGEVRRA